MVRLAAFGVAPPGFTSLAASQLRLIPAATVGL